MDIIIFGAGRYYNTYKIYLDEFNIKYIVDNDVEKQGKLLDGKVICDPKKVNFSECAYIIILIKSYEKIEKQLLEYNVPRKKIVIYSEIGKFKKNIVKSNGKKIPMQEWVDIHENKKIMLVSHELSRTGVPIALMNLAILLKKLGYDVLYVSLQGGSLSNELKEKDIDYIDELKIVVNNEEFVNGAKLFDLFIAGTVVLADYIPLFERFDKPIMWWMHETDENFFANKLPGCELKNVHYYGGGRKVVQIIKKYLSIDNVGELLYFLPKLNPNKLNRSKNKKLKFVLAGSFCKRKAQDVLAEAISLIPLDYEKLYEIVFIGAIDNKSEYYKDFRDKYPEMCCKDEMTQDELNEFYNKIDVLVCPSREDSMPIVVTQAMQYGIPCIVSDKVGQADYIRHGENGFVFTNEDCSALAEIMIFILQNPDRLKEIGNRAKAIFEEHFTEAKMRKEMLKTLDRLLQE